MNLELSADKEDQNQAQTREPKTGTPKLPKDVRTKVLIYKKFRTKTMTPAFSHEMEKTLYRKNTDKNANGLTTCEFCAIKLRSNSRITLE